MAVASSKVNLRCAGCAKVVGVARLDWERGRLVVKRAELEAVNSRRPDHAQMRCQGCRRTFVVELRQLEFAHRRATRDGVRDLVLRRDLIAFEDGTRGRHIGPLAPIPGGYRRPRPT